MFNILKYLWPSLVIQFSDVFYVGKKKTPISLKKNKDIFLVKLGSGFASYTLESNKKELEELINFVQDFLDRNK
jgi:hypothetical protein